ncbi:Remorin, C-terminal [Dillenia turbinata]|uniref:Remorin, C-terminal n=1 Tax=Dillenia turbinata TaxID=194707 RepID=A0AAN8UV29_9MAGN
MIQGQRRLQPTTVSETSPNPSNITTNSSVLTSAANLKSRTPITPPPNPSPSQKINHSSPSSNPEEIFNASTSWSLNFLVAILPTSPSPICSSSSRENSPPISPSDHFFSRASSASPTPRNQAKLESEITKLRKKEAAISEWESMQTKKAMSKLKEIEKKLEKVHSKAKEKSQKKVIKVRMKANQQKAKERRLTVKKISAKVRQTGSSETCTGLNLLRSF